MHKRAIDYFVIDILITLERLKKIAQNIKTKEDILCDENLCDAVLRRLEILGEAARHIMESEKFGKHVNREWRKIVNFRNLVAHEYFGIDFDIVFDVLTNKLCSFEGEVFSLIAHFSSCKELKKALIDSQMELERFGRIESMLYLRDLEKLFK